MQKTKSISYIWQLCLSIHVRFIKTAWICYSAFKYWLKGWGLRFVDVCDRRHSVLLVLLKDFAARFLAMHWWRSLAETLLMLWIHDGCSSSSHRLQILVAIMHLIARWCYLSGSSVLVIKWSLHLVWHSLLILNTCFVNWHFLSGWRQWLRAAFAPIWSRSRDRSVRRKDVLFNLLVSGVRAALPACLL
jgi:hypothetical protein